MKTKRLLPLILAVCLIFPCFSLFSVASAPKHSEEFYRLLEEKENNEWFREQPEWGKDYVELTDFYGQLFYLLLYTPAVEKLTFEVGDHLPCSDIQYGYCNYTGDIIRLYRLEGTEHYYQKLFSSELGKITEKCYGETVWYDEVNHHMSDFRHPYAAYPQMREVVKVFNLSKEDILEAFRISKTNPECVRDRMPTTLTDSEFQEIVTGFKETTLDEHTLSVLYDMWMIEDEEESALLLYPWWKTKLNGKFVHIESVHYNPQEYMTEDAKTPEFRAFLNGIKTSKNKDKMFVFSEEQVANFDALLAYANELPQTGDATPVYLAVAVVSGAVLLSAAAMIRRKKKFD